MGFFQGASGVHINGGTFNQFENGAQQIVYDQSRHYTNVNSFNTANHATIDSHNDHSRTSYDNDPKAISDKDQKRSKGRSQDQDDDVTQYFPPPTIHPAMQHALHRPGDPANVSNVDSFNVNNSRMTNAHNDYSQKYGLPPPKRRKHRRRVVSEDYQNSDSGGDYDGHSSPSGSSDHRRRQHPYATPPPPSPYSSPYPPRMQSMYQSKGSGSYEAAQYYEGQMQTMGGPVRQTFETLMQQLQEQTAPQPNPEYPIPPYHGPAPQDGSEEQEDEYEEGEEEGSDEDEDDETGEEDTRMEDPPVTLAHKIGHLSLNDTLQPAFSRVKSNPEHRPTSNSPQSLHVPPMGPRRAGSTQDIPAHLRRPFVARSETLSTASSEDSLSYAEESEDETGRSPVSGSAYYSPGPSNSSWSPNIPPLNIKPPNIPPLPSNLGPAPGSIPSGFHLPMSSIQGPAVFNKVQGNLVQVDRTVHTQNVNSGNTHNTIIKDSYNNNSVATYYASPDPVSSKKAGKQSRSSRKR